MTVEINDDRCDAIPCEIVKQKKKNVFELKLKRCIRPMHADIINNNLFVVTKNETHPSLVVDNRKKP